MFRASLCPSSGAYQLQQQPLVYRRNVVVAMLLVVVGPALAGPTTTNSTAVMGIRMPETCWAVSRRQTINLYLIAASGWLIHLNAWRCTDLHTLNLSHTVCNETCQWKSIIRKVKWIRLNIYTIFWLPTGTFSLNSGNPVVYSGQVQSNQMKHATNPRQANTGRMHFQSRII